MQAFQRNFTACLFLLALVACDDFHLPVDQLSGHTMGTTFSIELIDASDSVSLHNLDAAIYNRLEQLERIASTYQDTAEISKFNANRTTEWIDVSKEFCLMVGAALQVSKDTHGAFDITVSPLVDLWGFGPAEQEPEPPPESDIERLTAIVGYENLATDCARPAIRKLHPPVQIDLSGWAKGYAVDELALLLDASGLDNYLVEIGGEIKVKGLNAERRRFSIGIENPSSPQAGQLEVISVSDTGVATSGDYRNFFEHRGVRYSHVIDPRTGNPVRHNLSAVTVVHPSTAYADAMATAFLVLGPDDGLTLADQLGIAAYFAVSTSDGLEFRSSDAFSAERYLSNHARM